MGLVNDLHGYFFPVRLCQANSMAKAPLPVVVKSQFLPPRVSSVEMAEGLCSMLHLLLGLKARCPKVILSLEKSGENLGPHHLKRKPKTI